MPEHRIRLRGAWDWQGQEGDAEVARRVDLPVDWPEQFAGRFRLLRRFGRPPFDPASETAHLELMGVAGLASARLNGLDLGVIPAGITEWEFPLTEALLLRNSLILEVDLPERPEERLHWGKIALVISPRP